MKKKVIKDYKNLPEDIREAIREQYPKGYINHIITFFDRDKQLISALPYETEEISYLIKMPASIHLVEEGESGAGLVSIPEGESLENLDEEKYLIQEEEEESD